MAPLRACTLAVCIAIFLAACTSSNSDGSATADPAAAADQTPSGSQETGSPGDAADNGSSGANGGRAPEDSTITVTEPAGDATSSGDVDGYPELASATIEGSAEGALFDLGFARAVPEKTPKATQMTLALSIVDEEGSRYLLNAIGTEQGWSTTVVTSKGQMNFGGKFDIDGKRVSIGVPWADLGGPTPFNWIVSSAWTGDPDKGMSYAFDSIPNRGFKGFPDTKGDD